MLWNKINKWTHDLKQLKYWTAQRSMHFTSCISLQNCACHLCSLRSRIQICHIWGYKCYKILTYERKHHYPFFFGYDNCNAGFWHIGAQFWSFLPAPTQSCGGYIQMYTNSQCMPGECRNLARFSNGGWTPSAARPYAWPGSLASLYITLWCWNTSCALSYTLNETPKGLNIVGSQIFTNFMKIITTGLS